MPSVPTIFGGEQELRTTSGQATPHDDADTLVDLDSATSELVARTKRAEDTNAVTGQRGRSWALTEGESGRVPCWTSRETWLGQIAMALGEAEGVAVLRAQRIAADTVVAIAQAMAQFAESSTGRRMAASRARIAERAGCGETTVKRARRVLAELGMAVEIVRGRRLRSDEILAAELHHGARQVQAASNWVLSSPREIVQRFARTRTGSAVTQRRRRAVGRGPLSLSSHSSRKSPARSGSPTRARPARRLAADSPRGLAPQRAAAEIAQRAPLLAGKGHIGALVDVIAGAGIDLERWRGRDIVVRLDQQWAQRRWAVPAGIRSPLGYLRWRLAQIDWSEPSPLDLAARHRAAAERDAAERAEDRRQRQAASTREGRRAAMELFRQARARNRVAAGQVSS